MEISEIQYLIKSKFYILIALLQAWLKPLKGSLISYLDTSTSASLSVLSFVLHLLPYPKFFSLSLGSRAVLLTLYCESQWPRGLVRMWIRVHWEYQAVVLLLLWGPHFEGPGSEPLWDWGALVGGGLQAWLKTKPSVWFWGRRGLAHGDQSCQLRGALMWPDSGPVSPSGLKLLQLFLPRS